jgi:hypothetical protein
MISLINYCYHPIPCLTEVPYLIIFQRDLLSDIGTVSSIIGLLLTVIVFINIRKIKNFYLFRARVPELIDKLSVHSSNIASYQYESSDSLQNIPLELAKAEVVLQSLEKKLKGQTRISVQELLKIVREFDVSNNTRDDLWNIYVGMMKVIEQIKDIQEDLRWER